jgi:nucleotide-binding universal stress UspA family protein
MKVLLATDGSDGARAAADFLRRLPLPRDTRVAILTVIDKEALRGKRKAELDPGEREDLRGVKETLRQEAREALGREQARLRAAGWKVSCFTRTGHPAEVIVRAAAKRRADLVVVGSHGRTALKRFLLGSVSDRVRQYAPCSVLVVKPPVVAAPSGGGGEPPLAGIGTPPLHVLVAYDDSPPAREAVSLLASLPFEPTARVTVLTVLPLLTLYRQDIKQRLSWAWRARKAAARQALARVTEEVEWATPQVEAVLTEGADVSDRLLAAAAEREADLVVLGHKGRGAIEEFLLGSVTSRVAHHAPCSVLAVRG